MRKGCIFRLLKRYWKHRSAIYREQVNEWYDIFDEEVSRIPEIPQGKLEQLWISIEGRIGYRFESGVLKHIFLLQQWCYGFGNGIVVVLSSFRW